jgi:hypothetical protein
MINQAVASLILIDLRDEIVLLKSAVDTSEEKYNRMNIKMEATKEELINERKTGGDPRYISELEEEFELYRGYLSEFGSNWQLRLVRLGQTTDTYNLLLEIIRSDQAEYARNQ